MQFPKSCITYFLQKKGTVFISYIEYKLINILMYIYHLNCVEEYDEYLCKSRVVWGGELAFKYVFISLKIAFKTGDLVHNNHFNFEGRDFTIAFMW